MTAKAGPAQAPVDDGGCYACGPHNAQGLGLRFETDGSDGARAQITLPAHVQGYRGIAHGGIVSLLLDEVMAYAAGNAGLKVVTAALAVRFRAPVPLGVCLSLGARVVRVRGKIVQIDSALRAATGALLASAQGSFVSLGPVEPGWFDNFTSRETV